MFHVLEWFGVYESLVKCVLFWSGLECFMFWSGWESFMFLCERGRAWSGETRTQAKRKGLNKRKEDRPGGPEHLYLRGSRTGGGKQAG